MFNYHNRQYIFRQANGELWNFFCDSRQNLCYNTLTRRGTWSNAVILHKNAYQYFYAEMDQEELFHLLFQDTDGNILYSRLDGQSIKTIPLLNSKAPSVYNKQFFMAPFKNSVYFFYVLQHENSFMLAYQVLSNSKISNPKVVDYVSGSSLPCAILYDNGQNIYAFYQAYDGKFLQLGYKKFSTQQKSWSEFTPATKYSGNCEYPHVLIDDRGILHLCYQRRAPKLFEMVYQQKAPDKNLWTTEVILHTSVHSFENASIVQMNDAIVVYWVREDTIYYNTGSQSGNTWSKPSRLNFSTGRQLQCLSYKSNSPRDRAINQEEGVERGGGDSSQLPPVIYPGSFSNGLKLAFMQMSPENADGITGAAGGDIRNPASETFRQLQGSIGEVREGWSATREELARLNNAYGELTKELAKYVIRMNMLESQLGHAKTLSSRLDALQSEIRDLKGVTKVEGVTKAEGDTLEPVVLKEEKTEQKIGLTLEPDKLKEWQEWKEPKEWQEGSE